ncbi:hypothetical protein T4E_9204 [Trichinella pseudospiralis]|uniref:Uncharacterized protein n=1 Tax=Trichinella pseudospiralis TaxID=6337 RepID=A0A0V0XK50_TRIPS|nr:hypothetical protein T4E_9204 [Trichinella pseudospiralis]
MVCSSIGRNSCEEQSFQMMLKQTIWLRTQFETLLLYDCASVEHYFRRDKYLTKAYATDLSNPYNKAVFCLTEGNKH